MIEADYLNVEMLKHNYRGIVQSLASLFFGEGMSPPG
jgi:hypothetical protein